MNLVLTSLDVVPKLGPEVRKFTSKEVRLRDASKVRFNVLAC